MTSRTMDGICKGTVKDDTREEAPMDKGMAEPSDKAQVNVPGGAASRIRQQMFRANSGKQSGSFKRTKGGGIGAARRMLSEMEGMDWDEEWESLDPRELSRLTRHVGNERRREPGS